MIGERLSRTDGHERVRVLTEPFSQYFESNLSQFPDQVVLVEYTSGPSAGKLDVISIDQLVMVWEVLS